MALGQQSSTSVVTSISYLHLALIDINAHKIWFGNGTDVREIVTGKAGTETCEHGLEILAEYDQVLYGIMKQEQAC